MSKATKATKNRLATCDFTPRVRIATLLEYIVKMADIEYNNEAFYTENNSLYYKCHEDEKPLFRGLQSKYPNYVETTLMYGLNEVVITDINKLVKAMLNNR